MGGSGLAGDRARDECMNSSWGLRPSGLVRVWGGGLALGRCTASRLGVHTQNRLSDTDNTEGGPWDKCVEESVNRGGSEETDPGGFTLPDMGSRVGKARVRVGGHPTLAL